MSLTRVKQQLTIYSWEKKLKVSTINCHDLIHFEQPALAVTVLTLIGWASDKSSLDQSWSELDQTNYITFDLQMKIALKKKTLSQTSHFLSISFLYHRLVKKKKEKNSFPDISQSCKDIMSAWISVPATTAAMLDDDVAWRARSARRDFFE